MHYRILYNPSIEVTVKACFLEFMQICNLRMSTFLNDNMVYRVNSRAVWNLRQRRPVSNKQQQKRKKKDYQKNYTGFSCKFFSSYNTVGTQTRPGDLTAVSSMDTCLFNLYIFVMYTRKEAKLKGLQGSFWGHRVL